MDIDDTIQAKASQLNAVDLVGRPVIVTVEGVDVVGGDQPVHVHLAEYPGRPYKPSKGMRRVLVALWGKRSAEYAGKRLELFCNPDVLWAGKPVGGIQISAASGIDKPVTVPLVLARGKQSVLTIQPLNDAAPSFTVPQLADADECREYWTKRRDEGAGKSELDAIQQAAAIITNKENK